MPSSELLPAARDRVRLVPSFPSPGLLTIRVEADDLPASEVEHVLDMYGVNPAVTRGAGLAVALSARRASGQLVPPAANVFLSSVFSRLTGSCP